MIYDDVLDLEDKFSVFMLDAYGVFWDGAEFYKGSKETMEHLVEGGKVVCILSNATCLAAEAEDTYKKKGIVKNKHYHEIITSGEVARHLLETRKIDKLAGLKKIYQFGTPSGALFKSLDGYEVVDNLKDADFVYISVPQFTEAEFDSFSTEDKKYLFESRRPKEGEPKKWDSTRLDLFNNKITGLLSAGLPFLNANPDLIASEPVKGNNNQRNYVIRQGYIGNELKRRGALVVEIGKPNVEVYEFAFNKLKNLGISVIDRQRIVMVGDTLATDIRGAMNAEIKSILCMKTGVTYRQAVELLGTQPQTLERLESVMKNITNNEGIWPDYYVAYFGSQTL
ncbi:MAG: HAD hydrolase-like protein [Rickettsiales bacterium]|jgi:HAD superfamily hydrolase (TIGR01450 family)|nr:HAD hydrolase-like protein [Rickettsiales bacterium]